MKDDIYQCYFLLSQGYYYLFYSSGWYFEAKYHMRAAKAKHPTGPFIKRNYPVLETDWERYSSVSPQLRHEVRTLIYIITAGTEHHLGGSWPRLCAGGWRLLVDVLPRLELGQSGQPGRGQTAPAGQDHLEQRMASTGQSQCTGDTGSTHHRR